MSRRRSLWLLALIVIWVLVTCGWSATATPTSKRYWDERFSVKNAREVLKRGNLRPENAWYSRLSYLPQTGLLVGYRFAHELVVGESPELFTRNGDFTPVAYYLARFFSVLCGAAGAVMTFLIGRRLFGAEVALLGTALLVMCPWLIRHFVMFKADAFANLLVLIAFYWSLKAAESPSWRRFLLCGVLIGLAASAKYTGALIAIPLVVVTLLEKNRWTGRLARLALAGATSIGVLVALHPYLDLYTSTFRRSVRRYATAQEHSFASMLVSEVKTFLHESFYGPLIGAIAVAGVAALFYRLYRLRDDSKRFRELAMFLSFPVGYSVVYALVTSLPKGNNYLVLLPFTSLAAAWLLHSVWTRIAGRLQEPARRLVFWPALVGLLALAAWPAHAFLYDQSVPTTTLDRVEEVVTNSSFARNRIAIFEGDVGGFRISARHPSSETFVWTRQVPSLAAEPEAGLDAIDYEIFDERRLRGPESDFYRGRIERLRPEQVATINPEWFRVRGPSRIVLLHPWFPPRGEMPVVWTKPKPRAGRFVGRLPGRLRVGELISIAFALPSGDDRIASFTVGDENLEPIANGWDESAWFHTTERFRVAGKSLKVALRFEEAWTHSEPPGVGVWIWRPEKPGRARRRTP